MGKRIKYLAVIPARGGSKGIPRKNIKVIAGKPLIAWTIEAAKQSKLLDDFVVSTEDPEIARISKKYGAKVIDRPKELAGDKATTLSVKQHVLSIIDAEVIVLLQPTSPIRDKGLIDRCIKRFQAAKADNLVTGFMCKYYEYGVGFNKRRQDMKEFFYCDGNVYVTLADLIKNGKVYGKRNERLCISREQNLEIDDEFDFWMCEQVLQKRAKG